MDKDLKSCTLRVFSIYSNFNQKVIKRKLIKNDNLYKLVYPKLYESNGYMKPQCNRIFNEIENNFYTYKDFLIALLYTSLFTDKKIQLKELSDDRINEIKLLFTKEELKKSEKILLAINKNIIFNNISEYFKLTIDKETHIYNLIKKKFLSPIIWLKYGFHFNDTKQEYKESVEHNKFRKICEYLNFNL